MSDRLDELAELLKYKAPDRVEAFDNWIEGEMKRETITQSIKTRIHGGELMARKKKQAPKPEPTIGFLVHRGKRIYFADMPADGEVEAYLDDVKKEVDQADVSDLVEAIKAALKGRTILQGRPMAEIAKAAGTHPSSLYRFMHGERSINLETAAKLVKVLELVLVPNEVLVSWERTKRRG
jgi:DNA-binding phage protein